jgi:glycosyltransferase involved in cell wall biosynthesis
MKIAHFVFNLQVDGGVMMAIMLANQQSLKEEVRLYVLDDFIDESIASTISPSVKVVFLNRKPGEKKIWRLFCPILKLNVGLLRFKPDIIHLHQPRLSKVLLWKWRIVHTVHGTDWSAEEHKRMKAIYAVSQIVKDIVKKQGFESKVIYNGIKTSAIKPKDVPISSLAANRCYHLVQVARINIKEKGQDIVIDALRLLKEEGISNFEMHFVGKEWDIKILERMTHDYGLDEKVTFEGVWTQEYLYKHLCDFDCLIMPSPALVESFSLATVEAMVAKVPVLVSDIPGPMEVIDRGRYGMVFHSGDAYDLAEKLKQILQGGYDYSMLECAHHHACEEFDIEKTAIRYIDEYKKIM